MALRPKWAGNPKLTERESGTGSRDSRLRVFLPRAPGMDALRRVRNANTRNRLRTPDLSLHCSQMTTMPQINGTFVVGSLGGLENSIPASETPRLLIAKAIAALPKRSRRGATLPFFVRPYLRNSETPHTESNFHPAYTVALKRDPPHSSRHPFSETPRHPIPKAITVLPKRSR